MHKIDACFIWSSADKFINAYQGSLKWAIYFWLTQAPYLMTIAVLDRKF